MGTELNGRRALVTGGGVGIGSAVALALAEAGADVAITYRSHDGQQVADQIAALGRRTAALELDATDGGRVDVVVADAIEALGGPIDILVNNAGGLIGRAAIAEMSDEHWHQVIDVNLYSAFAVSRAVLREMPEGGPDHQHLLGRRTQRRRPGCGRLRCGQGGHARPHLGTGQRSRAAEDHRQCGRPGVDPRHSVPSSLHTRGGPAGHDRFNPIAPCWMSR